MANAKLFTPREAAQVLGVSYPRSSSGFISKKSAQSKQPADITAYRRRKSIAFSIVRASAAKWRSAGQISAESAAAISSSDA